MAESFTSRSLTLHLVLAVVLVAMFAGRFAFAIEAGDYECHVESIVGVTTDGDKTKPEDAPQAFRLQAVDAPVTPDELRRPLHSLEYYQPERSSTVSASIDVRLFHQPTKALRSSDGVAYTQGTTVVVFADEGVFMAYGLAEKNALSGLAIYSGKCSRL